MAAQRVPIWASSSRSVAASPLGSTAPAFETVTADLPGERTLANSAALLAEAHRRGLNTAIETACNVPWRFVEKVLPHVDTMLHDYKLSDRAAHRLPEHRGRAGRGAARARAPPCSRPGGSPCRC